MVDGSCSGPRLLTARGTRALEQVLLRELDQVLPRRPEELEPPVRVLVPSKSLRHHLSSLLVRRRHRALAGVTVQTLYAAALEACERMGRPLRVGDAPFEILARRLAAGERSLQAGLGHLEDGYAAVSATLRDLLDAGFEPALTEPLHDQVSDLAGGSLPAAVIERAAALVRVAGRLSEEAQHLGLARTSDLLRLATELITLEPRQALPSRAVLVYGYTDATGTVLDLIEAVTRHLGAVVLVDQPADPAAPETAGTAAAFSLPFLERLSGAALPQDTGEVAPEAVLQAVAAPTREAEVREVVARICELIATGVPPEAVGVVARDLRAYASALRRCFDRLAIPFSAVNQTVPAGRSRRRRLALVAILHQGVRVTADRWLEACELAEEEVNGSGADLLLALRSLGACRLDDVADLDTTLPAGPVVLPLLDPGTGDARGSQLQRRHLPRQRITGTVARAVRCRELLETWPDPASADDHAEYTLRLLEALGREPLPACAALAEALPQTWLLSREEWTQLLAAELDRQAVHPLGGCGGGVQVLGVMEARARTFQHLFVLGCNRDLFPRMVREDPLLPDTVRGRLAVVLPDIPIKARGWSEEFFLFNGLLSAGEVGVTLSWSRSDAGRPLAASPFVERLRLAGCVQVSEPPCSWADPTPTATSSRLRPAFEHGVGAGLAGDRQAWTTALQAAAAEGLERAGASTGDLLPAAIAYRRALLDEIESRKRRDLLPALAGCIGSRSRSGPLVVTELERMAVCPWQTFVTRVLGVSPAPDPLLDLPGADPRLVGTLVHRVLQRIVEEATGTAGASLPESLLRLPVEVPWPSASHLEAMLALQAEQVARAEGLLRPGVAPMLAEVARPFLEVARQVEWQGGTAKVDAVGAEVSGDLTIAGQSVRFRADRLDHDTAGLCLTDYKTGRNPAALRRSEEGRRKKIRQEVEQGRTLQAVVYALAVGGRGARGRYLFLRTGDDDEADPSLRELLVTAEDDDLVAACNRAMTVLLAAVHAGAYPPRVEEAGKERAGGWCRTCPVREACLRTDSAFRRRLVAWMNLHRRSDNGLAPAEGAAAALWWLGVGDNG